MRIKNLNEKNGISKWIKIENTQTNGFSETMNQQTQK
jgi:hypothetical protein